MGGCPAGTSARADRGRSGNPVLCLGGADLAHQLAKHAVVTHSYAIRLGGTAQCMSRVVARSVRQAHEVENGLVRAQEAAVTSAIAAMSAGPTRQQPPTSCAPAVIQLRTSLGSKVPAPAHACEAWSQASPRFG